MNNFDYNLAKEAYTQYGSVTEFKNYQGLPMPQFDNLPETIRNAWIKAAKYCYKCGENNEIL